MAAIVWSSILTDHKENSSIGLGYDLGTTRKMKKKGRPRKTWKKTIVEDLDKMGSSWQNTSPDRRNM